MALLMTVGLTYPCRARQGLALPPLFQTYFVPSYDSDVIQFSTVAFWYMTQSRAMETEGSPAENRERTREKNVLKLCGIIGRVLQHIPPPTPHYIQCMKL